jgi:multicomponent Na+:H+ antiporter subunit D
VDYIPYTGAHVVGQLQLLMFGIMAFYFFLQSGYYPSEIRAINIDFDWFYRKPLNALERGLAIVLNGLNNASDRILVINFTGSVNRFAVEPITKLTCFVLAPFTKKESVEQIIASAFRTGSSPIGIYAAATVLFIVVLYIFL